MIIFAKRLLELRTENHLSQAKLAKNIDVSVGIICYWETNRSEPTGYNIVKIAKYFKVSTDYLLGLENFES